MLIPLEMSPSDTLKRKLIMLFIEYISTNQAKQNKFKKDSLFLLKSMS
jgi:hypothetical protein